MPTLGNPQNTIAILKKYDFHMQKRFGQNFLIDANILEKIIHIADISIKDLVLEIGPGIGTLTQYLCERAGQVVAVEIDKALMPILEDTLGRYENVEVICGDILELDVFKLIAGQNQGNSIKVVANLPYYITTPILMSMLESHLPIASLTVMVQKEVARRMKAGPGTKDYGALSLAVQYYAKPDVWTNVSPNSFIPRPTVGSTVIRLNRYEEPPAQVKDERLMFRLIRAAFNQRRKTLANALGNSQNLELNKEEIAKAIGKAGLPANIRGEALDLEQFAKLSNLFSDMVKIS